MWHLIDLEVFHQMQSNVRLTLFFYVRWMIAAWNFMSCYNIKSIHTCPQHIKKCWNEFNVEVNESSILYKLVIPEFSKKIEHLTNWIESVELIGVLMQFICTFAYYALWSMKQLEPKVVFEPTICVHRKEKVNRVLKPTIEFSRLSSIF